MFSRIALLSVIIKKGGQPLQHSHTLLGRKNVSEHISDDELAAVDMRLIVGYLFNMTDLL